MFGSILGTLQKFRADENKVKDRELKKRQIEKKIELKTEKEREDAKREKRELIENRWKGQRELKVLQVVAGLQAGLGHPPRTLVHFRRNRLV